MLHAETFLGDRALDAIATVRAFPGPFAMPFARSNLVDHLVSFDQQPKGDVVVGG